MDLQSWFYLIAIIFMIISLCVLTFVGILFFLLYRKISDLQETIAKRIQNLIQPATLAVDVGAAVAGTAIKSVRNAVKGKK